MQVFISHSTPDDVHADTFQKALTDAGLTVWVDHQHGIVPADDWSGEIQKALHSCDMGLFLMTEKSLESKWCKAEYLRIVRRNKPLYTVQLESSIPLEKIPSIVDVYQIVDCTKDFDAGLINLVKAMTGRTLLDINDPTTIRSTRLTGDFPRVQLDIPISGRDDDLAAIRDLLAGNNRLVVIQGIGGMGKTRLAAELAITAEDFTDGVIWQTFTEYTKVDALTARIREHLNLPAEYDTDAVWGALAEKQALIILDNAESCTDKAAFAQRLQHYALDGGTRILMTSREHWRETRRFNRAYDLAAPDLDSAEKIVHDMATQQGVIERVAGKERNFAEKGRRHPRLIQYALGWLHDYPLTRVFTMLDALKGGEDVQEALDDILHRTLRQVENAPNGPQAIADLKKLLVCRGGFTDDAAEAILGSVDNLSLLRRWNLIGFDGTRYNIDPLIDAALESDTSAHPAHFEFYKALVQKHHKAQDYLGLFPENDNLEAAFEWAMATGEYEKAFKFASNCGQFLFNRMLIERFQIWLERVVEKLQDHPDASLRATIHNDLGVFYGKIPFGNRRDNLRRAINHLDLALVYRTPEIAPMNYAMTQNNLGATYAELANIEESAENLKRAVACFEAALVYWTSETAPLDYATTQNNLGNAHAGLAAIEERTEDLKHAITCYEAALVYRTPEAAPLDYAQTQHNLGTTYADLATSEERVENLKRAITCYKAALIYLTPEAAPLDYAATQNNLGTAYQNLAAVEDRAENLKRAIACYEAALIYRTPDAAPLDYAGTQVNLGLLYKDLGDTEKLCAAWCEAEKYYRMMEHIEQADKLKQALKDAGCDE